MMVGNHSGVSSGEPALGFHALATWGPAILRQADSPGSGHPELAP